MTWDREKIKQVLQELSKLPDFDCLPIPEAWGKEFDIPITPAKVMDLKSYLKANQKAYFESKVDQYEVIYLPKTKYRHYPMEEPPKLIIESQKRVIIDENGNETLIPLLENSVPSTESSSSEQPVSQVDSSTNVSPSSHDAVHTSSPSLRFDV